MKMVSRSVWRLAPALSRDGNPSSFENVQHSRGVTSMFESAGGQRNYEEEIKRRRKYYTVKFDSRRSKEVEEEVSTQESAMQHEYTAVSTSAVVAEEARASTPSSSRLSAAHTLARSIRNMSMNVLGVCAWVGLVCGCPIVLCV